MGVDHFVELVHLLTAYLQKNFLVIFHWIKNIYISENLLKVRGHVGFLMFSHLQNKIFVAETNKQKNQISLNVFFWLSNKKL